MQELQHIDMQELEHIEMQDMEQMEMQEMEDIDLPAPEQGALSIQLIYYLKLICQFSKWLLNTYQYTAFDSIQYCSFGLRRCNLVGKSH